MVELFTSFETGIHYINDFPQLEYPEEFKIIYNHTQLPVAVALYNYPTILFDGTGIDDESLSKLLLIQSGKLFIGTGVDVKDTYGCGVIIDGVTYKSRFELERRKFE